MPLDHCIILILVCIIFNFISYLTLFKIKFETLTFFYCFASFIHSLHRYFSHCSHLSLPHISHYLLLSLNTPLKLQPTSPNRRLPGATLISTSPPSPCCPDRRLVGGATYRHIALDRHFVGAMLNGDKNGGDGSGIQGKVRDKVEFFTLCPRKALD